MKKFRVSIIAKTKDGSARFSVDVETDERRLIDGTGGDRNKIFDRMKAIALSQNPKLSDYKEFRVDGYS